jgi:hypothetical protein
MTAKVRITWADGEQEILEDGFDEESMVNLRSHLRTNILNTQLIRSNTDDPTRDNVFYALIHARKVEILE